MKGSQVEQRRRPERYIILENLADVSIKKFVQAGKRGDVQEAERFKKQAIDCLSQAFTIAKAHFPAACPHLARLQGKLEKITKDVQK